VADSRPIWARPELTVLVRSTPEESVLGQCKSLANPTGSKDNYSVCAGDLLDPETGCYEACFAPTLS
jgi:hypothetical protein